MTLTIFPLKPDKSPATGGQSWKTYSGKVETPVYGVAVPPGRFIIDRDSYKKDAASLEEIEEKFGCKLDWDAAYFQTTKKGGTHYCFTVPEGLELPNETDVLGLKGVDTRSAGKGYVATGDGYEDPFFSGADYAFEHGDYPELPQAALDALGAKKSLVESVKDELDDLIFEVANRPLEMTLEEVEMYVDALDPELARDEASWREIIMAIHHQTRGSDEGWRIADNFSKKCPDAYKPRENKVRWKSFGGSQNPITFYRVMNLIGDGKRAEIDSKILVAKSKIVSDDPTKDGIVEMIKALAETKAQGIDVITTKKKIIEQYKKVYGYSITMTDLNKLVKAERSKPSEALGAYVKQHVFLTNTGEFMNMKNKTCMGPRAFDLTFAKYTPSGEDGSEISPTQYAKNKIRVAHMGSYSPQDSLGLFERDGIIYANTYRPGTLERVPQGTTDVVDVVKNHVANLIENKEEQELFINYLAHNVQFPGKKIFWSILLQGVQGDGKSFFAEMMSRILGEHNTTVINAYSLEEQFTGWAENHCMVFVEEVKLNNIKKYDILNKLKQYISNPTISIRKMRTDQFTAQNTANYMMFTNFTDALPIDNTDRRYAILFSRFQSAEMLAEFNKENPYYYKDLYDKMRENVGELKDWLLDHVIPQSFVDTHRAPDTVAKQRMIEETFTDAHIAVLDAIRTHECEDINNYVVNVTKLQDLVEGFDGDRRTERDFPTKTHLSNVLKHLGYHRLGRYPDYDKRFKTIYCKDGRRNQYDFRPPPF